MQYFNQNEWDRGAQRIGRLPWIYRGRELRGGDVVIKKGGLVMVKSRKGRKILKS